MREKASFIILKEEHGKETEELICLEDQKCWQQQRNQNTERRLDRERCQEFTGGSVIYDSNGD